MILPAEAPVPTRVLVTGGAGFIGARTTGWIRRLAPEATVVAVDDLSAGDVRRLPAGVEFFQGDVTRPGVLDDLLGERTDAVLHLAARVGVRRVLDDPEGCRRVGELGVHRLVQAVGELAPDRRPRVFAASTSEVYRDEPRAVCEDDLVRPLDGTGRWAYAASKLAAEARLDEAQGLWTQDRRPVHLRFFNVVGPGQDAASGMVLANFLERALAGRSLPVHGDGSQVRTLAHVDDVALALARMVTGVARVPAGPLNLGGAARTTIFDLARLVARVVAARTGTHVPIVTVDPRDTVSRRFEEVRHREPELGKAHALGLCRRARDLESIVTDTVEELLVSWTRTPLDGAIACASPAS